MGTTDDFKPAREQDAWATLRGFRYQVDLSILRWITLGPKQYLELERGEDIDQVAQALSAESNEEFERTLEQVKVRANNLTLRSTSALEALANAHSQQVANPSLSIRFCYTTNAAIGRERRSPFPAKTPGIDLWEQIRKGQLSNGDSFNFIQRLRHFLSEAAKPKKLSKAVWSAFTEFVKDAAEDSFLGFIRRFEWSLQHPMRTNCQR